MKVAELIAQLRDMPQEAIVVVRGYEDGVNEADNVTQLNIKPFDKLFYDDNGILPWWYGSFESTYEGGDNAVYISSTRDGMRDDELIFDQKSRDMAQNIVKVKGAV